MPQFSEKINCRKYHWLLPLVLLLSTKAPAQSQKSLQRDWIKVSTENLSAQEIPKDTLYTRYSFTKSALNISFYPGWNDYNQTWSMNGKNLKLGFDTYKVEVLNDTALVISLNGFRRFRFVSEEYLSRKEEFLDSIGTYNNKTLYEANDYFSPRYKPEGSFRHYVEKSLVGYNIKKAAYFKATFIVTEDGSVENVQIVNGITYGFDEAAKMQIAKSSGKWRPASVNGKKIQTQMTYDIKYLDSLTPFN